MNFCRKCVIPDTRPGVKINEEGVCLACVNHGKRPDVDWNKRKLEFKQLVARAKKRSTGYDCLVPVSGGKDSTWQVLKCLEYGLNPLTVTTVPALRTQLGWKNLNNLIRLGVDHIDYQVNPKVESKFVYQAFVKSGSAGLPMHMAMYRMSLNIGVKFRIPFILWGENSSVEYGSAEKGIAAHLMTGNAYKDWVSKKLTARELTPYFGPTDKEMDKQGIEAVFLGYYFPWDVQNSLKAARAHGFQVKEDGPKIGYYNYVDLDDDIMSVHHYLKWYKFGFTRAFDNVSLEIRNQRLTRAKAINILRKMGDDRPDEDIKHFCDFVHITEKQFDQICEKFRNKDIWYRDKGTWKIKDFLTSDWRWKK